MTPIHSFTIHSKLAHEPRAASILQAAHALGITDLVQVNCADRYYLEGALDEVTKQRLAAELLSDPVAQRCSWQDEPAAHSEHPTYIVEAALRLGVTDSIAEHILRAAQLLGIKNIQRVATGYRYTLTSRDPLTDAELHNIAQRLLVNPVIHYYALQKLAVIFPGEATSSAQVTTIPIRALTVAELEQLSQHRRAALDTAEMLAIQGYYQGEGRDPTDVEFEMLAQTWSEHCVHKTFRAKITCDDHSEVNGLLKTYIRAATEKIAAPWVSSAFVDNAGIIEFDADYHVSFKVETHNHPSAIEPFGGANTGLGGVIRDILGVSAKPIAATDVFCFGPQTVTFDTLPTGTLHPRRIQTGVVAGVQDYGNKTGIPTVNGAIFYDAGYIANPLVYCGCVGIAPAHSHCYQAQVSDRVIVLGGRTGRDGLRGATFSSMTMDAQTGEVAGASVQIGDPIIAKGLIEVVTRARDAKLYHAITDCGAGGLSSAVGEMASVIGADVDLAGLPLKYSGLAPWEIWLSEAQERMLLAVPVAKLPELQALCDVYNIELTNIGQFTGNQRLVVRYQQAIVLDLANAFLFEGIPQRQLTAELPKTSHLTGYQTGAFAHADYAKLLLSLLAHPNIASKTAVIRRYDHEVQGATVIKPLVGVVNEGPADAAVLKPLMTQGQRGIVIANGINPWLGKDDPYRMALSVIDEAIRNAVAVGANPNRIAILDNFCWGDPKRPSTLGALVAASRGCYDAALHYGTPFISGKDSLNNEYLTASGERHAIPSTLLISALGIIDDIHHAVSSDLKAVGNQLFLIGTTHAEFGGSHLQQVAPHLNLGQTVPDLPELAPALYRALHQAMVAGLVAACHDLSEGGLAVTLAEMCIGGQLGCTVELTHAEPGVMLFSESNGRLVVEVPAAAVAAFSQYFQNELAVALQPLGVVTATQHLQINYQQQTLINLPVTQLVTVWQGDKQ